MAFALTAKQEEANRVLGSRARHILLYGGSRSGKSFLATRAVIIRGAKAPGSSHVILRARFNHLKHSVIYDTLPKMIRTCFPELPRYESMLNKTDWFLELPNRSRVLFGGLDDKERTEKILGQEHSTLDIEEASQVSYGSRNKAVTRLAQDVGLIPKAYYTCNPPSTGHWLYKLFIKKIDPVSGKLVTHPDNYASVHMNPADNPHLAAAYMEELDDLPAKDRKRFQMGEFAPQTEGALWTSEVLDRNRVSVEQLPEMQRITINIDPSGCSGPDDVRSDEIGLTATAIGKDKKGYLLEDISGHYSPEGWARAAVTLYDKWDADVIIGEKNFGGDMVAATIRGYDAKAPIKLVTASRGKTVRAEPVASLYEQNKIKHLEIFPELEDQYCNFSTAGYQGTGSPDRADSAVWGFTELMLGKKVYGMLEVA